MSFFRYVGVSVFLLLLMVYFVSCLILSLGMYSISSCCLICTYLCVFVRYFVIYVVRSVVGSLVRSRCLYLCISVFRSFVRYLSLWSSFFLSLWLRVMSSLSYLFRCFVPSFDRTLFLSFVIYLFGGV